GFEPLLTRGLSVAGRCVGRFGPPLSVRGPSFRSAPKRPLVVESAAQVLIPVLLPIALNFALTVPPVKMSGAPEFVLPATMVLSIWILPGPRMLLIPPPKLDEPAEFAVIVLFRNVGVPGKPSSNTPPPWAVVA